jgi:nitroreductase
MQRIKSQISTTPFEEIVRQRFSCRTYIDKPIDEGSQQQLIDYLKTAGTGPFGSGARFGLAAATEQDRKALRGLGTYGFIRGATGFIIGAIHRDENKLEDFGYLLEKIIIFATEMGLGTCWLGGSFTKSSFARKISAQANELVPAVVSVGYIATKPRRIESLFRSDGSPDRRLGWKQLFFDEEFEVPLDLEAAGKFAGPLEMVRLAPSASNRQPWRIIKQGTKWHIYLRRTPGYRKKTLVKLFTVADLQRIDMGIAMCHFELMARDLDLDGSWEVNQPDIEVPDEHTEYTISWVC